jgi:hypothetical protein
MLPAGGRIASLCLLLFVAFVTAAEAAPWTARTPRSHPTKAIVCDPHTTTLRALRRQLSSPGPVAKRSKRSRSPLLDGTPRVQRRSHRPLSGDDEAIQNDTPAARVAHDETYEPAFRPIGLLSGSFDRLPTDTRFSPRSPRGPPTAI